MRIRTAALTLGLALLLLSAGCAHSGHPAPTASPSQPPAGPAHAFLAKYVDPDGRVVRRDQGGDTVSEGQGYALLLAVAAGDGATFRRVWAWTRDHLELPSGLFAYRWSGGAVAGRTPAADADQQIAWALALGGKRFGDPALTAAARRVARAVADAEIGYDDHGAPVLAAGPWALRPGRSTVVEPGYWTPPAEAMLAALTGDKRWRDLGGSTVRQLRALTQDGARLPPDWATVGGGHPPQPVRTPNGGAPAQAGPDGLRAMVWSACNSGARPLLARWWTKVSATALQAPLTRALDGTPTSQVPAPLSAVAAAAAAQAAGDHRSAQRLLDRARQIDQQHPTYYGAAWLALGEVLLTSHRLPGCAPS